jgi:hypothetical protein
MINTSRSLKFPYTVRWNTLDFEGQNYINYSKPSIGNVSKPFLQLKKKKEVKDTTKNHVLYRP